MPIVWIGYNTVLTLAETKLKMCHWTTNYLYLASHFLMLWKHFTHVSKFNLSLEFSFTYCHYVELSVTVRLSEHFPLWSSLGFKAVVVFCFSQQCELNSEKERGGAKLILHRWSIISHSQAKWRKKYLHDGENKLILTKYILTIII